MECLNMDQPLFCQSALSLKRALRNPISLPVLIWIILHMSQAFSWLLLWGSSFYIWLGPHAWEWVTCRVGSSGTHQSGSSRSWMETPVQIVSGTSWNVPIAPSWDHRTYPPLELYCGRYSGWSTHSDWGQRSHLWWVWVFQSLLGLDQAPLCSWECWIDSTGRSW